MVGKSAVGQSTQWAPGGNLSSASVAPESQIAIARPGRDDSSLRVYYQENITNLIREIMYWDEEESWSVSSLQIFGATVGTRLSAVSAKPPGDIRLFYQHRSGLLQAHFFKQESLEWSFCKSSAPQGELYMQDLLTHLRAGQPDSLTLPSIRGPRYALSVGMPTIRIPILEISASVSLLSPVPTAKVPRR